MPGLEFQIKTPADLSGAKAAEAQLERDIAKAKSLGESYTQLEAKLGRVRKAMADHETGKASKEGKAEGIAQIKDAALEAVPGLSQMEGGLGKVLSLAQKVTPTFAAAAVGLAAFIKLTADSIREFAAGEKVIIKRDAALAQSGQLTEKYRQQLSELAETEKELTGIEDEVWTAVQARLTQMGSGPETIERDMQAVKNLAGLMDGDLVGASQRVGAALQGNFARLEMLGIKIDEHASQVEKLDSFYRQAAQRGGGQLEAMSETLSGKFGKLKNAAADLLKPIGAMAAEWFQLKAAMDTGSRVANYLAEKLGHLASKLGISTEANEKLKNSAATAPAVLDQAATATDGLAEKNNELASATGFANSKLEAQKKVIEDLHRQQDELNHAELALKNSLVDDAEKRGAITHTQGLILKERYQRQSDDQVFKNKQALADEKVVANESAVRGAAAEIARMDQEYEKQKELIKGVEAYEQALAALAETKAKMQDLDIRGVKNGWDDFVKRAVRIKLIDDAASQSVAADRLGSSLPEGFGTAAKEKQRLIELGQRQVTSEVEFGKFQRDKEVENAGIRQQQNVDNRVYSLNAKTAAVTGGTAVRDSFQAERAQQDQAALEAAKAGRAVSGQVRTSGGEVAAAIREMGNANDASMQLVLREIAQIKRQNVLTSQKLNELHSR